MPVTCHETFTFAALVFDRKTIVLDFIGDDGLSECADVTNTAAGVPAVFPFQIS
jgi:hypothetical protein